MARVREWFVLPATGERVLSRVRSGTGTNRRTRIDHSQEEKQNSRQIARTGNLAEIDSPTRRSFVWVHWEEWTSDCLSPTQS